MAVMIIILTWLFLSAIMSELQRFGVDVLHSDFDHVVKMIIISRKLLDTCCTSPWCSRTCWRCPLRFLMWIDHGDNDCFWWRKSWLWHYVSSLNIFANNVMNVGHECKADCSGRSQQRIGVEQVTFPSFVICFIAFLDVSSKNIFWKSHKNFRTSTPPLSFFYSFCCSMEMAKWIKCVKHVTWCEVIHFWKIGECLITSSAQFEAEMTHKTSGTMASSGMDLIPSPRPPSTWQM